MTSVNEWATVDELAAHYIARAHQAAHDLRFISQRVPLGAFETWKAWNNKIEQKKTASRADIDLMRSMAKELVPDPARYAEVSQHAISNAKDVSCSKCYGRFLIPVKKEGKLCSAGWCDYPEEGPDGSHYHVCRIGHNSGKVREAVKRMKEGK